MNIESLSEWFSAIGPEWFAAIGTIAATVAAVVIAAYTFHIGQRNNKIQGLRYIFELLDDNGHRNARRRIINLFGETDENRKIKILKLMGVKQEDIDRKEAIMIESKEIVKADFEEVGFLMKNKEIPHDDFIKIYWRDISKCWHVLETDIKKIQETDKSYMENFEYLNKQAKKYKKEIPKKLGEKFTKKTQNKVEDLDKLVIKDIIVYPIIEYSSYDPASNEIAYKSDETLNTNTLNNDTIFFRDENKMRIVESQLEPEYKVINDERFIIIKIIKKPPNKKCYLFLSKSIEDIYGNTLKEDIQSDRTF